MSSDVCPSDPAEVAEQYGLDLLSKQEAATFEDHFITCRRCVKEVEEASTYIRAMRGAARQLLGEVTRAVSSRTG